MNGIQHFNASYDIVVVGGGITGATAALALQNAGLTTLVIDKVNDTYHKPGECLTPKCRVYLEQMGFSYSPGAAVELLGIDTTWGNGEIKSHSFLFNAYGTGLVINRRRFEADLLKHIASCGAAVNFNTTLQTLERKKTSWQLGLISCGKPYTVDCRFIIAATGRNYLRQLGPSAVTYYDRQVASTGLLANRLAGSHEGVLCVAASPMGWHYSVVIPGGRTLFSAQTDVDVIRQTTTEIGRGGGGEGGTQNEECSR